MKTHKILKTEGDWEFGTTFDDETGVIQNWSRLTEQSWKRKFWFLQTPKERLKEQFNLDIDSLTSEALSNTLSDKWTDFCYYVNDKTELQIRDIIKLVLGPYAQFNIKPSYKLLSVIINSDTNYNEKKNILLDILETNISFEEALLKHKQANVDDDLMKSDILKIINDNPEQWTKAQNVPNLLNWFVGQYMKTQTQKPDAAKVKQMISNIALEMEQENVTVKGSIS